MSVSYQKVDMKRTNKKINIPYRIIDPDLVKPRQESVPCIVCGKYQKGSKPYCWIHSPYILQLMKTEEYKKDMQRASSWNEKGRKRNKSKFRKIKKD